jgi:hypothetical protein
MMQLTAYAFQCIIARMLQVLTTDEFAEWFASLGDAEAEDVATMLEVVERLGHERAAPGSSELLLWYEYPRTAGFGERSLDYEQALDFEIHAWGVFRDYAGRVLKALESPRFAARVSRLTSNQADAVFAAIKNIKMAVHSRARWALKIGEHTRAAPGKAAEGACAEVRRLYFAALEAAGFEAADVPAHTLALREMSRRRPAPGFRILYGIHGARETALFVLGERLDRAFYGDSVRRAESMWTQFLDGTLRATEPALLR